MITTTTAERRGERDGGLQVQILVFNSRVVVEQ